MTDTIDHLLEASGWEEPDGFAVITEAVWWVTMVDATLVRYHPDAYGRALASREPRSRKTIEDTFGGLRFVRNRMGYEADHVDFIRASDDVSGETPARVADWTWKPVAAPACAGEAGEWELIRHRAYQAELAGALIGATFSLAAAFLGAAAPPAV